MLKPGEAGNRAECFPEPEQPHLAEEIPRPQGLCAPGGHEERAVQGDQPYHPEKPFFRAAALLHRTVADPALYHLVVAGLFRSMNYLRTKGIGSRGL